MGFVIHHSIFSTSSSPCTLQPPFLFSSPRNALTRRKNRAATACLKQESPKDDNFCKRRVILYMGFASIPLLKLRAEAVEGLAAGEWGLLFLRYYSLFWFFLSFFFLCSLWVLLCSAKLFLFV